MEPENGPLEKEIPIGFPSFPGSMLVLGGVRFEKIRASEAKHLLSMGVRIIYHTPAAWRGIDYVKVHP